MMKSDESWGRFAAKAAVLGVVVLVAAFVGTRFANALPGEPVRKALTVSGTLTGPMVTSTTTATFRFYRAQMGGEALCSPVVSIRDGMERNPTTGAFSVEVPLDQMDVAGDPPRRCPDTLFHDPNAYVEVAIGGTPVVARRPINPVPYAVYAQQYGTPDCPVGYQRDDVERLVCKRSIETSASRAGGYFDQVVRVGEGHAAFWVDRYEASIWSGNRSLRTLRNDVRPTPTDFPPTGQWARVGVSVPFVFAYSDVNLPPAISFTWFQAAEACRASGKRLPTNEEWQAAAQGTQLNESFCRTNGGVGLTGQAARCASHWGAQEMIGHVWEWTADWFAPGTDTGTGATDGGVGWPTEYGMDESSNVSGRAFVSTPAVFRSGVPAAVQRGGSVASGPSAGIFAFSALSAPVNSVGTVGFRCVIPR